MSERREKAEDMVATIRATAVQQAVAFAIATESCVDAVEGMLKIYEERGRQEEKEACAKLLEDTMNSSHWADKIRARRKEK